MSDKRYDAIVVGSGLAGSYAAKELTQAGMEVLLIEAGPYISEADFKETGAKPHAPAIELMPRLQAALRGQYMQARYWMYDPLKAKLFVNDRQNPYTTPPGKYYIWMRGKQLGGRMHTYGRVLLRFSDFDFKAASLDGFGEDWPISYAEMAPYYSKVEEFIGVYGMKEGLPQIPDGIYPMTPQFTPMEQIFKAKIEARWPERRVTGHRVESPNLKRTPRAVLAALDTGKLDIRTETIAKRVTIDQNTGKATGVECIDCKTHKTENYSSSIVVLCGSTIESVRVMFNSACSKHPSGLGNSTGNLGHYFMDQTCAMIYGSVPGSKGMADPDTTILQDPLSPRAGGVYIPRYINLNGVSNPNFKRGYAFQGTVGGVYSPHDRPAKFGFMSVGEMLPYYDNIVTVNTKKKDAWGIPVPHISCTYRQNELEMMKDQIEALREMVETCGYNIEILGSPFGLSKESKPFPEDNFFAKLVFRMAFKKSVNSGSAIHEVGGARMGTDPGKSVLNPYNQCWDVNNLFVTDGASFVTNGMAGPALSVMAVTARACAYMVKEYKAGRF
jgi:choline dehydrogenase-like flavoprotein